MIVAAAMSAVNDKGTGVSIGILRVVNKEDGRHQAKAAALLEYPLESGWRDHKVSIQVIPDEWVAHPEPV